MRASGDSDNSYLPLLYLSDLLKASLGMIQTTTLIMQGNMQRAVPFMGHGVLYRRGYLFGQYL